MKRYAKNVTGGAINCADIPYVFPPATPVEILEFADMKEDFMNSADLQAEILAGNIQVGAATDFWYTNPYEGLLYLKTEFDDSAYILSDSTTIDEITVAIVEDSATGIKSTAYFMNMLTMMREMYNAESNPVYDAEQTPILGEGGWAEDHADRIDNLESIHGDLGWHELEITRATYQKPDDILIYYGWINSFNSAVNGWDNEKVAQDMARYGLIVLGDGVQDSGHGDYANTQVVIARVKALNPRAKIFGYVTINQSQSNFEDKVDDWETLQIHGIFLDEAGYDYGTTTTNSRSAFNTKVDYVHGQTYAKLCFANSWNMDHVIGTENDVSYPNTTWNAGAVASKLNYTDWYLLESFAVNTTAYSSADGYAAKADWATRGSKAISHRATYGINLAAVNVIANTDSDAADLFDFCFTSACMFAFEASGSSDTSYGASSAKVDFQTRPDVCDLDGVYATSPSVQVDAGDADVYWRYVGFGSFKVDFSTGAQDSVITKW